MDGYELALDCQGTYFRPIPALDTRRFIVPLGIALIVMHFAFKSNPKFLHVYANVSSGLLIALPFLYTFQICTSVLQRVQLCVATVSSVVAYISYRDYCFVRTIKLVSTSRKPASTSIHDYFDLKPVTDVTELLTGSQTGKDYTTDVGIETEAVSDAPEEDGSALPEPIPEKLKSDDQSGQKELEDDQEALEDDLEKGDEDQSEDQTGVRKEVDIKDDLKDDVDDEQKVKQKRIKKEVDLDDEEDRDDELKEKRVRSATGDTSDSMLSGSDIEKDLIEEELKDAQPTITSESVEWMDRLSAGSPAVSPSGWTSPVIEVQQSLDSK